MSSKSCPSSQKTSLSRQAASHRLSHTAPTGSGRAVREDYNGVERVARPILGESMEELLNALTQIGNLKDLPRAGWVREQVPYPESVADHSFRAMVFALVLGPQLG